MVITNIYNLRAHAAFGLCTIGTETSLAFTLCLSFPFLFRIFLGNRWLTGRTDNQDQAWDYSGLIITKGVSWMDGLVIPLMNEMYDSLSTNMDKNVHI